MNAPLQPPHSLDAEVSVLGGLLLLNSAFDDVASVVRLEDFYRTEHQQVFAAIAEMAGARKPFDFVTLTEHLRNKGRLEEAGGTAYVTSLAVDTYSTANLLAYARIVRERSVMRRLIAVGTEMADIGYRPDGLSVDESLERAERLVYDLRAARVVQGGGLQPLSHFAGQVESDIERMHKAGGGMGGISTGFHWLDRKTDGLHAGDLVIVAGRPGHGKSTFAMNIAEHVAFRGGKRVDVFSMEMQGRQLALRTLAGLSRVPMNRLRGGALDAGDWDRIAAAGSTLRTDLIQIDETGSLSPSDIRARVRRSAARGGLAVVVVDYLQLMQVAGSRENRTNQVSEITRSLKALAKEFGVAVIALSQLSRANEKENRKPKNSDLRDSGGIEQDADVVLFVYRENEGDEAPPAEVSTAELIIGKQRSGPTGSVFLNFYGACSQFEEMSVEDERAYRESRYSKVVAPTRGFGRDIKRAAAGDS